MTTQVTSKELFRQARDFVGKSRCSLGHSVSEVQDRANPGLRHCSYCEHQWSLYQALAQAYSADEPAAALEAYDVEMRDINGGVAAYLRPKQDGRYYRRCDVDELLKSGKGTDQTSRAPATPVASGSLPNTLADSTQPPSADVARAVREWVERRRKELSKQGITHGHYVADLCLLEEVLSDCLTGATATKISEQP